MHLLEKYEALETKDIDSIDVFFSFDALTSEQKVLPDYDYERIAWSMEFTLASDANKKHFLPYKFVTSLPAVTADCLAYWNNRRQTAINPRIRLRYSELVREYKHAFPAIEIEHSFYQESISLLISVIEGNYICREMQQINAIHWLFELLGNKNDNLPKAKEILSNYVNNAASTGGAFPQKSLELKIILEHSKAFTDSELEAAFQRYTTYIGSLYQPTKEYVFFQAVQDFLPFLKKYHPQLMRDYIFRAETLFRQCQDFEPMKRQFILMDLQKAYAANSLNTDAQRLNKDIQVAAADSVKNMEHFSTSINVPYELFELQVNQIIPDDTSQQFAGFLGYFIPRIKREMALLQNSQPSPLDMMTTIVHDDMGSSYKIGSLQDDPQGHLLRHLSMFSGLRAYLMSLCINKMQQSGVWSLATLQEYIARCPIISEHVIKVLHRALVHYFNGEYAEFCYMVVPQLEYIVRHVIREEDGTVIKAKQNSDGYQLITLGDLLRDQRIDMIYNLGTGDESVSFYLRFLLTDPRGLNLRNRICHGIGEPSIFSEEGTATLLLHALLFLTNIQLLNPSA